MVQVEGPDVTATLADGQAAAALSCLLLTTDDLIDYKHCQSPRDHCLAKIKASTCLYDYKVGIPLQVHRHVNTPSCVK